MSTDGSSDAYAKIIIVGIVSSVFAIFIGLGTWMHSRAEARKDAACASQGGVRVEVGSNYLCIRKSAIIEKI
jgi:cytochrome oxidase assembly protein ShyY1